MTQHLAQHVGNDDLFRQIGAPLVLFEKDGSALNPPRVINQNFMERLGLNDGTLKTLIESPSLKVFCQDKTTLNLRHLDDSMLVLDAQQQGHFVSDGRDVFDRTK
jgi:hypothetical protein